MAGERTLAGLASELRARRYTHLLDLHDSFRTRLLRALVPGRWRTYPKHRVARSALIHAKRNLYADSRPVPERYFSAARDLDVKPDGDPPELFWAPEAGREVDDWLAIRSPTQHRALIALAPGAAHATKRWPQEHWLALVQLLIAQGFDIALVGGAEDIVASTAISNAAPEQVLNAAGRFGLQGTAALLQRAAAVVSGDTGVMHMATAVGTPVVGLFGPTVEPFGFFPYTARARVVELALDCRPCSSKGGPRCPLGHHRCMRDMHPELVFEALRRWVS
jgi:lipopolysaccharide heptosyltransferase II